MARKASKATSNQPGRKRRAISLGHALLFAKTGEHEQIGAVRLASYALELWSTGKLDAYWRTIDQCLLAPSLTLRRPHSLSSLHTDEGQSAKLVRRSLDGYVSLLTSRWGVKFREPEIVFSHLRDLPPLRLLPEASSEWLKASSKMLLTDGAWHADFAWAALAERYLQDLSEFQGVCRKRDNFKEVEAIDKAVNSLIDVASFAVLRKYRDENNSIVFCGTHCGVSFPLARRTLSEALESKVTALMRHGGRADDITAAKPAAAFYSLVKALRRDKNYLMLAGDGRGGTPSFPMDICGRSVLMATGAPHAVFHAKCKNVFYIVKWVGRRMRLEMNFETQIAPGENISAWTNRWMGDYHSFLTQIIQSEPENLRCRDGLWLDILPSRKSAP